MITFLAAAVSLGGHPLPPIAHTLLLNTWLLSVDHPASSPIPHNPPPRVAGEPSPKLEFDSLILQLFNIFLLFLLDEGQTLWHNRKASEGFAQPPCPSLSPATTLLSLHSPATLSQGSKQTLLSRPGTIPRPPLPNPSGTAQASGPGTCPSLNPPPSDLS